VKFSSKRVKTISFTRFPRFSHVWAMGKCCPVCKGLMIILSHPN
jgi:hypothetical protein